MARAVAGLGTGLQVSKEGLIASLVKLCAIFAIDFQLAALNPKFVWSGFGLAENDLSAFVVASSEFCVFESFHILYCFSILQRYGKNPTMQIKNIVFIYKLSTINKQVIQAPQ